LFIGETAPGQSLEEERKSGKETDSQVAVYNPNVSLSIEQQRQKLPIFKVRWQTDVFVFFYLILFNSLTAFFSFQLKYKKKLLCIYIYT
jgi:hypothetical protein